MGELSKKAKRRLRQKLRNKEMNGITQDQIVKEVNALKTMKRLNANGRIDELERVVPNVKAINGSNVKTDYESKIDLNNDKITIVHAENVNEFKSEKSENDSPSNEIKKNKVKANPPTRKTMTSEISK